VSPEARSDVWPHQGAASPTGGGAGRSIGGPTEGNQRLTVIAGLVLIPLLAVLGVTILFITVLLVATLAVGLMIAVLAIPDFGAWTSHGLATHLGKH
jgi:hypothetical protein